MDPFTKPGKSKKTEIISLDYSYVAREQRNKIGIVFLIKELLNLVIQKYCNCYEYIVWINKCRFLTFPPALYHVIFYRRSFTIFNDVDDFISISKNFPFSLQIETFEFTCQKYDINFKLSSKKQFIFVISSIYIFRIIYGEMCTYNCPSTCSYNLLNSPGCVENDKY